MENGNRNLSPKLAQKNQVFLMPSKKSLFPFCGLYCQSRSKNAIVFFGRSTPIENTDRPCLSTKIFFTDAEKWNWAVAKHLICLRAE